MGLSACIRSAIKSIFKKKKKGPEVEDMTSKTIIKFINN